jgi:malate dehydrogenase (oxaloacetate-decarboxylating)(NADP+)
VVAAYGGKVMKFGPDYFIPKPFDPRVLWWVAPAVARAAIDSGVARKKINIEEYADKLMSKSSNAAYSIMRAMTQQARRHPKRVVFADADNIRMLRAIQQIVDEDIAKPILLGRPSEIESMCRDLGLDLLDRVEVIDPRYSPKAQGYADKLFAMRQRKGVTLPMAKALVSKSSYYAAMMVEQGDADGMVTGMRLSYPETVRPALEIFGLEPGRKVAVGMYMMILQNSVRFFGDTVFNIDPDADTLADIALQMSEAVASFGVTPRVAMISYSNFGSVRHPDVTTVQRALAKVQALRPDLEIDGEMQPELAFDAERRREHYGFAKLSRAANTWVFSSLAAGNAAYQTLKVLGGVQAVGPILLGVRKPVAALQSEATVEDIVNMTAYVVRNAQRQQGEVDDPVPAVPTQRVRASATHDA